MEDGEWRVERDEGWNLERYMMERHRWRVEREGGW